MMIHKALAEMLGTFTIIFFGCGSILLAEKFPTTVPGFCVPVVFGLVISLMIFAVGHISGAHFNPAVTLAFVAAKRFPTHQILIYWMSQFCGGLGAIGLLAILKR